MNGVTNVVKALRFIVKYSAYLVAIVSIISFAIETLENVNKDLSKDDNK